MNLELPEKEKIPKKRIIMYAVILLICVIAVIVVVGVQILGNDVVDNMFGINKITKRTEEEEANLKANFENIFDNQIEDKGEYKIQKIKQDEDLVYTNYTKEEKNEKHEIDVNLPYININNEETDNFNKEIENTFKGKAEEILKDSNQNIIYIVKYKAYVENNILSLVIRSTLKEDSNPQRDIIQTYNYDLTNQKECTMQDLLELRGITKQQANQAIKTEIETVQKTIQGLEELGLSVYARDPKSDIYSINNVTEYFIGQDNAIYIIFAYGNENNTSEMDIVVM